MARARKRHVREWEDAAGAAAALAPVACPPSATAAPSINAQEARSQYLDFIRALARGLAQRDLDAGQS